MCWEYKKENYPSLTDFFNSFGKIVFAFGKDDSIKYEWDPSDYLYHVPSEPEVYCLGVEAHE